MSDGESTANESSESFITAYRSVGSKCSQAMDAFEHCRKKHARAPWMCSQLESAVTWCALGATCPPEARSLQECADAYTKRGRGNPLNPPKQCEEHAQALERCVDERSSTQQAVHSSAAHSSSHQAGSGQAVGNTASSNAEA